MKNDIDFSLVDRMITITAYDTDKGIVYATDDSKALYLVKIDYDKQMKSLEKISKTSKAKLTGIDFLPFVIDEKMEEAIPVGSKIIATGIVSNEKKAGIRHLVISRVLKISDAQDKNVFSNIFKRTSSK